MSRRTVTCQACGDAWPFDPAFLVACPTPGCRAKVGAPCYRPSGHRVPGGSHNGREQAALDAGVLKPCRAAARPPALAATIVNRETTRTL